MTHQVTSTFTVRSYEVDSYAHLNNGVYLGWFEQGRLDHLQSLGYSYDSLAEREQWFVVGRTEIDFRRALTTGDAAALTTTVSHLGRSSVRYTQVLRDSSGEIAAEGLTIMVFTDRRGSIPIPGDFRVAVETGRSPDRPPT